MSSTTPDPSFASDEPAGRAAPARRDDSALRLQDIAKQLSELAQKERETGPPNAFDADRRRAPGDEAAVSRLLERIDDNERQTVEAFSAVNERLSVLSRQLAALPRDSFARPEDVPGYSALESAIRNVVEHIEVSEKRTRESLKSMQDRLGEISAQQPGPAETQRTGPLIASLEARITELSNRLLRTESALQAGMPEQVRREFAQITERIDNVKQSATNLARTELREIETRVLASLKEVQATAGLAGTPPEIGQIRGEIGGLARRMDEIKANSATERDLHALRLAVEHLSSRVAQSPDQRPLQEMDRRLGEFGRKLDQVAAAAGSAAPIQDIEARLADLGQRVEQAMRTLGDPRAIARLDQAIADVSERVDEAEEQLGHIETMEQAIRQLYASLEQNRDMAAQAAEDAAGRAVDRMLSSGVPTARSPELKVLEEGLRAVRESAAGAERRNQETLAAVHETLSQIVEKIAELEAAPAAARSFAAEQPAPVMPRPEAAPAYDEPYAPPAEPEAAPPPAAESTSLGPSDDFIAAARRAAQAAATRPSALRAEFGPVVQPQEEDEGSLSLLRRFHRRPAATKAKPAPAKSPAARRRVLLVAGAVLLMAVAAFAYKTWMDRSPLPAQAPAVEAPAMPQLPAPSPAPPISQRDKQTFRDMPSDPPSDPLVTGSTTTGSTASLELRPAPATGTDALRTAAQQGDAAAQFIVATRYLEGNGIAADPAHAAYWYGQAAVQGLAPAQYRLGTLYELGSGVAKDLRGALSWYERAAAQGNVKSMHNAAVILLAGGVGPPDPGKAFALFTAAAERGLRDSQFNLAILHERGMGTQPNRAEAIFWYRLAASQGDSSATERAAALEASVSPAEVAAIAARVAKWTPQTSDDSANIVAVIDPAWQDPDTTVSQSGVAEPAPAPAASSDLVVEAQQLLLALGFNVGAPDGRLGSRTVAALRKFQAEAGLAVTGEVTPELLEAMRARAG